MKRRPEDGSRVSARLRIAGWILLMTALSMLAVLVTLRSIMLNQIAEEANNGIVQEVDEFSTFASEGVDPTTAKPFTSVAAAMERYLSRQTPATGEAIIAVTPSDVLMTDNAPDDAGEHLARDRSRLQSLLRAEEDSGVTQTRDGELRWGRTSIAVNGERGTLVVAIFTKSEREQVSRSMLLLVGVALAGLLLTAAIAWLVAGQILRPLRQIRDTAGRVRAGDLSPRAPVEGRDDLADLATAVNAMLDRIERAHDARHHATEEARRRLDIARRDLTRGVHLLEDADASDEERSRGAALAQRALRRLGDLDDDLDLLARADDPDFVHPRPTLVHAMMTRLVADLAGTVDDRRLELVSDSEREVEIDAERVAEAMTHLVRNARRHTEDDDLIEVGATDLPDGDGVRLWVANDGSPLDEETVRALLERYRSDDDPGMGLGLAVVRAVADAHGGSAWIESSDTGHNRFGLDLPGVPPRDADQREPDDEPRSSSTPPKDSA